MVRWGAVCCVFLLVGASSFPPFHLLRLRLRLHFISFSSIFFVSAPTPPGPVLTFRASTWVVHTHSTRLFRFLFFRTKSPRWDLVFQFHLRPPGGQRKKLKRRLFSAGPTRHGAESVSLVAVHVVARRRTSPFIHSSLIFCPFRSVRVWVLFAFKSPGGPPTTAHSVASPVPASTWPIGGVATGRWPRLITTPTWRYTNPLGCQVFAAGRLSAPHFKRTPTLCWLKRQDNYFNASSGH